jgi:hypothetical protein
LSAETEEQQCDQPSDAIARVRSGENARELDVKRLHETSRRRYRSLAIPWPARMRGLENGAPAS